MTRSAIAVTVALLLAGACQKTESDSQSRRVAGESSGVVPPPADVAAPPPDAGRTAHGVFFKWLVRGQGTEHPNASSEVKVSYTGWTTSGEMFDTSSGHEPVLVHLSGTIPGWTESLAIMVVGDKARFWVPQELAYRGLAGRPRGMLVFDVELVEILGTPLRMPGPPPSAHRLPPGMQLPGWTGPDGGRNDESPAP